ncbi:MAG: cache domain-containing protein [Deltaproteobacteria bacterium]|nr:cache domain-containing protein [Deltaproteobacteria bacterium]
MKHLKWPKTWRGWLVVAFLTALPLGTLAGWGVSARAPDYPRHLAQEFARLTQARKEKMGAALDYLEDQRRQAQSAARNPEVETAFAGMLRIFRSGGRQTPEYLAQQEAWDTLYVREMGGFYDVLLVSPEGTVFHSIKKERDLYRNILGPDFLHPGLTRALGENNRDTRFVDFAYYSPSEEQAAFYVTALEEKSEPLGWLVLQVSLSAINALLTQRENLGRTGEVYLVNRQRAMLTDSRFVPMAPEGGVSVNTMAVTEAFQAGDGNRIVKDYRDRWVLSSFQTFQFQGADWAILAEKDESEVLTDYYRENEARLFPALAARLLTWPLAESPPPPPPGGSGRDFKVDLKEFRKAEGRDAAFTLGVASCTVFLAQDPGHFVYLAHLTPTDAAYDLGWPERLLLGRRHSNLVREVLNRVFWFEVVPAQRERLRFALAATHSEALRGALHTLMSEGVELRQITALIRPEFEVLSVRATSQPEGVLVRGDAAGQDVPRFMTVDTTPDLETVLKRVLGI